MTRRRRDSRGTTCVSGERMYRAILRCYPRAFRDEFAALMVAFYIERSHDAAREGRRSPRARFWIPVFRDVIAGLFAERLSHALRFALGRPSRELRPRSQPRLPVYDTTRQHVVHSARRLRRSPMFTILASLMLALGIGVSTGMFSTIDATLLRPLPYADARHLVTISPSKSGMSTSKATLERLRVRQRAFTEVAGYSRWGFMTRTAGGAELIQGATATANLFSLLGVRPVIGRTFALDDDRPGHTPVVVLGFGYWTAAFAGSPSVVGQTISLNGVAHVVIGVMPRDFDFPVPGIDLWTPALLDESDRFDYGDAAYLMLVGRLRPGIGVSAAEADVRSSLLQLRTTFPDAYSPTFGATAVVEPLRDSMLGSTKLILVLLFGAVGFVLVITCANVGNLVIVRTKAMTRDLAVRMALGAGRGSLIMQVLIEMILLGLLGGAGGLAVAAATAHLVTLQLPPDLIGVNAIGLDSRALVFSGVVSILAGIAFGLAPALRLSDDPLLARRLREGSGSLTAGTGAQKTMSALLVVQFAMAFALTIGASLMIQTVWRLSHEDPGFKTENALTFTVVLPASLQTPDQQTTFYQQLARELARIPGATVGSATPLPFSGSDNSPSLAIESKPVEGPRQPAVDWRRVTPGYFATMQIPLVRGRLFTEADRIGQTPVALINETLAAQVFGAENPIGQRVRTVLDEPSSWVTIVGVVRDVKLKSLMTDAPPQVFRPLAQRPAGFASYVLQRGNNSATTADDLRRAVHSVDPEAVLVGVRPLDQMLSASFAQRRTLAIVLAVFASFALLLSTTGVFALVAYRASQRRREVALRLALGASTIGVMRVLLMNAAKLVAAGLVVGAVAAVASVRFVASQLYGVSAIDPATFATVTVVLTLTALAATLLPLLRVVRLSPVEVLKDVG